MFKAMYKLVVSFMVSVAFVMVSGCGGDSENSSGKISTVDDSTQAVFGDSQLSKDFRNSVIDLPDSFTATSTTISQKKSKNDDSDNIALDVYGGIFAYVKISDEIKEEIVDSFIEIYKSGLLEIIPLDFKHTFDEDDEFFSFKLEHPESDYNWKLSLYKKGIDDPVAISYFSKTGSDFKGKISLIHDNQIEMVVGDESTTLTETGTIEVLYDSNNDKKSLTIKAVSDLSELVSFAQANWDSLSESQKEKLDLSKPEKLIINITFENDEYSVGGTSYHGAGKIKDQLENEDFIFGSNNNTYMFKAKSMAGEIDGVKLAVALPDNQRADVDGVFEDASISKAFQKGFIDVINQNINRLLDDEDDSGTESEFEGDVASEKALGFKTLRWILDTDLPIDSLEKHGGVFTQAELDAAKSFWPEEDLGDIDLDDLDGINAFFASTVDSITQEVKETVYYFILAPKVVDEYVSQNISISIEDIQAMIARGSDEEVAFGEVFNTLMHIVNPAFFSDEKGFLGTYNGEKFFEFDSTGNKLSEGEKPENFDKLNALNLDSIVDVSAKEVFDLTLTVE